MRNNKSHNKKQKLSGNERRGTVIALFGANAEVEDETGTIFRCHLRKNAEPIVTGDQVLWQLEHDNMGVILEPLTRESLLFRPEGTKKNKLIAANIDAIIIVTAPPPIFSEYMIDRYLVATTQLNIPSLILLNKIDLLTDETKVALLKQLSIYEKLGYEVILSSIYTSDGLEKLDKFLQNKTGVLVGSSGVGKSSIIAALTKNSDVRIGATSDAGLGKHTTTSTRLYHLLHGGNLIDSPGVREFGLWHLDKNQIAECFLEFHPFLGQCKFRNCIHQSEPGCKIREAVNNNQISSSRFASYEKILADSTLERR